MSDNETFSDRLKIYLRAEGISVAAFEKKCGLGNGYIRTVKNPSTDKVQLILDNAPDLNRVWLLTGEGPVYLSEMTKEEKEIYKEDQEVKVRVKHEHKKVVPLISQYAYAGYLSGFSDDEFMESQPTYTTQHKHNGGNYIAFEVRGDSMDDNTRNSICHGDIILGCELRKEYWTSKLHIPKVFIIVHAYDGITVKEVVEHDIETGRIRCHSWNPSQEYQDFDLYMKDIVQMFYIKEISRDFKL